MRASGLSLRAISMALAEKGVKLSHEGVKRIVAP
jgi:transposase-like protein